MKQCNYCGMTIDDTHTTCPYCTSNDFTLICKKCGEAYTGDTCPACAKQREAEKAWLASEAEAARKQAVIDSANTGLVWKCILTFILPFIGGYFLVGPNVKTGPKVFALIWCVAFFLIGAEGSAIFEENLIVGIITSLVFLGPVIKWVCGLISKRKAGGSS